MDLHSVPSDLIKAYPARGPLRQYRFKEAIAFDCFRCGELKSKKSKLITIYAEDWNQRLCNACYGELLSIYEIKARASGEDEKAEALAELLLSILNRAQEQEAQRLFKRHEKRTPLLSRSTIRFLSTAHHVACSLDTRSNLDWSPAVIGLCKAVELEIVERLIMPMTTMRGNPSLGDDTKDKDIGRIAKFIRDGTGKPPELGTFAHFLQTLVNSKKRRMRSALMLGFIRQMRDWPKASWILDSVGLHASLSLLTRDFRNRAVHIDDLDRRDYEECRTLVIGEQGLLWKLVEATKSRE